MPLSRWLMNYSTPPETFASSLREVRFYHALVVHFPLSLVHIGRNKYQGEIPSVFSKYVIIYSLRIKIENGLIQVKQKNILNDIYNLRYLRKCYPHILCVDSYL